MVSFSVAVPLIAGGLCLIYSIYNRLICKPIPGSIPYNKNAGYSFLGDFPELIKTIASGEMMTTWIASLNYKHNSPIVQLFLNPFSKPWVIVADFRESQDILLRRTKEFDRSPSTTDLMSGLAPEFHIHMQNSDKLKEHKNLLRDLMMPTFLHQVAAPRVYASDAYLVKFWSLKARLAKGHPFNAYDDIFDVMLDTITAVAFGLDVEQSTTSLRVKHLAKTNTVDLPTHIDEPAKFISSPRPPTYGALMVLMASIGTAIQSPSPKFGHWCVRQTPSYRKAYHLKEKMIESELNKAVLRAEAGDLTETSALDNVLQRELAAAKKAGRPPNYNSRAIKDELLGFLVGGYDTTASTMTWGFKYISNHPGVQNTLRTKLRETFSDASAEGRDPSVDEIIKHHIPYLEATIEEIHRTAHTFGLVLRHTMVDTNLLGHKIPKGTDVAMLSLGPSYDTPPMPISDSQRHETALASKNTVGEWDPSDIKEFKPERWLRLDENGNQVFDPSIGPHLAFGLGPRGCFGRRLAYQSIRILLVLVLWHLELLKVEGELGSFKGVEGLGRTPVNCYLRLKEIPQG